jgi:GntR family transcriptional regulator
VIFVDAGGIDRRSGLPLHMEVTRYLRAQIESGELTGQLPSETELAARLRIGKSTLRKAMKPLRREGVIQTFHGHGSRVVPPGERG